MSSEEEDYGEDYSSYIPCDGVYWEPKLLPWDIDRDTPNWVLNNPYFLCTLRRFRYLEEAEWSENFDPFEQFVLVYLCCWVLLFCF